MSLHSMNYARKYDWNEIVDSVEEMYGEQA